MRNKDPGNILETIDRRLVSFGQKYQHSSQSPFLQFELHWLKCGGTGNDTSPFKGTLNQGNGC